MMEAAGPEHNRVESDFSYRCRPYAGQGYFLVGDAATFMDPIFSTGVCVAMMGGAEAAKLVAAVLEGKLKPADAQACHVAYLERSTRTLFTIIRQYYDHSFRELFLAGSGPLQVHRAVIGVLAGNVFPRPAWPLRWRLWFFDWCVRLNRFLPLVPRRGRFSLLNEPPAAFGVTSNAVGKDTGSTMAETEAEPAHAAAGGA